MKTAVVGGSGYGGGELLRLLAAHPEFEVTTVTGGRAAGYRVGEVFPHLLGSRFSEVEIVESDPAAVSDCDLIFLATPAGVSMAMAPTLVERGARVVDLSGAFRLAPEVYEHWYGDAHTAPELAPAAYGLPEFFRADLAAAHLIAVPGCSVTATLLGLIPLAGLVDPVTVTVAVLTGVSGAGRGLRDDLHAAHAMGNVAAYGAPQHRHTPEMEDLWARAALTGGHRIAPKLTFIPHLVPMTRGLVATTTARLAPDVDASVASTAFADAYDAEPFVEVVDDWPSSAHVLGSNAAHVAVRIDERTGNVIVSCAIDNLLKGAGGQALQAANAAAGLDEALGLTAIGLYP